MRRRGNLTCSEGVAPPEVVCCAVISNSCAAIFEAAATPWLTPAELYSMGFSQVAYPNILIGRVAKAIEHGLERLDQLVAGKHDAFTSGEQEMALKSLADALDLQKWKGLEKEYS